MDQLNTPKLKGIDFEYIFDMSPDLIFILDDEHNILRANRTLINLAAVSSELLVGSKCFLCMHQRNEPPASCPHSQLIEDGKEHTAEIFLEHLNGWFSVTVAPLLNKEGNISGSIHIARDITERKQMEEALHAISSRQQALLSAIPDIIAEVDKNKIYTWTNEAGLKFYGEDMVGKEAAFYFEGEQETYGTVNPLFDGSEDVIHVESWQRRRDGEKRLLSWWCRVLKDDGGNVIGALSTARDITKRKREENALKESVEKYRNIFENIQNVYYEASIDGTILEVSPSIYILSKGLYRREDLLGKNMFNFYSEPERRKILLQELQKMQRVEDFEITLKNQDGSLIQCSLTCRLVRDEDKQPNKIIGIMHDITERKMAEEALQESKAKYQTIFESTGAATLIVEEDTTILMANNECYSITGYTSTELIGQKWIQYVAPESLQEMMKNHRLRRQNPDLVPKKYEVKLVNKKGEIRNAIIDIGLVPTTNQSIVSILDITERKRVEEALQESEERYRALVENIGEGVGFLNEDEIFVYANPSAEKIFGVDKGELTGLCLNDFLFGENIEIIENETQKRRQGKTGSFEHQIVLKDGSKKDILGTASPCFEDKKFIGSFAIFRDMTERKKAETEIKLRTQQLIKVNAEKDKFFSIIAHDLRSPFNSFLGFTQMMTEEFDSMTFKQIQKIVQSMRTSASNLYNLLENLLEWSRSQRGITTFNPTSVLLMPKITESIKPVMEAANKKEVQISVFIPEDLVVFADENMFMGIMRNLFSNAVKFTAQGGKVNIAAKPISDNSVEISINDTGIGMKKEMIENLFKLDTDISRKGTDNEPSTGLGLIICKDFIEKHGEKIWVESEEGKGSTFYFTLPKNR